MAEVFAHPEHVPSGRCGARRAGLEALFGGYRAAVDWPQASFWAEIAAAFPDAIILLSLRDPESWWKSAIETIFPAIRAAESAGASGTR